MQVGLAAQAAAPARRYVRNRQTRRSAPMRCRAYALYSALLASPHEHEFTDLQADDIDTGEMRLYGMDLGDLASDYLNVGQRVRMHDFSALFEVGDSGPPVTLREQQRFTGASGIREELVRFYDFFGYVLDERCAWAPDHLSVMLEFVHFLCFRESTARRDLLSFQLAQLDFASRHLVHWTSALADEIKVMRPDSIYVEIARSLHTFLVHDHQWQMSTVFTTNESSRHG